MQSSLVMTVIGKDRTGLVEFLARLIEGHQGNWLESRMCRLGGEFAGILRINVPPECEQTLMAALHNLQPEGLTVIVCTDQPVHTVAGTRRALLDLVGHDRPGIVRQIAGVLAGHGVNVEELGTELTSAPMSGETLFRATARLQLPASCEAGQLREELENVAADLMVDLSLSELDANQPDKGGDGGQ